jgi:hypothetical protein
MMKAFCPALESGHALIRALPINIAGASHRIRSHIECETFLVEAGEQCAGFWLIDALVWHGCKIVAR